MLRFIITSMTRAAQCDPISKITQICVRFVCPLDNAFAVLYSIWCTTVLTCARNAFVFRYPVMYSCISNLVSLYAVLPQRMICTRVVFVPTRLAARRCPLCLSNLLLAIYASILSRATVPARVVLWNLYKLPITWAASRCIHILRLCVAIYTSIRHSLKQKPSMRVNLKEDIMNADSPSPFSLSTIINLSNP